jgi:tetratricopeptide (TPR) repeat protein
MLSRSLPPEHPDFLRRKRAVGEAYGEAGLLGEAKSILGEVLSVQEDVQGLIDPDTLDTKEALAEIMADLGDGDGAISLMKSVLVTRSGTSPIAEVEIENTRMHLGEIFDRLARFTQAIEAYQIALGRFTDLLGATHRGTLSCLDNLGICLTHAGRYPEAIEAFENCLPFLYDQDDENSDDLGEYLWSRTMFGVALRGNRDTLEAIEVLHDTYERLVEVEGPETQRSLFVGSELAEALILASADPYRVVDLLELDLRQRELQAPLADSTIEAEVRLAGICLACDRLLDAIAFAEHAEEQIREQGINSPPAEHALWYRARKIQAKALGLLNGEGEALESLQATLAALEILEIVPSVTLADCFVGIAQVFAEGGKGAEAIEVIHRAERLLESLGPADPVFLAFAVEKGLLYRDLGRFHEAVAILEDTLRMQVWVLGVIHEDTLRTQEFLEVTRGMAADLD